MKRPIGIIQRIEWSVSSNSGYFFLDKTVDAQIVWIATWYRVLIVELIWADDAHRNHPIIIFCAAGEQKLAVSVQQVREARNFSEQVDT